MYLPSAFREDDPQRLALVMRRHSFATLVTYDGQAPFATHLPVLHRPEPAAPGVLRAHLARANPQWRHFAPGREALVIFQGPHAYISPSWYAAGPAVPTWNYVAVHAYGVPRAIEDRSWIASLVDEMVQVYESSRATPWRAELPEDFRARMLAGIVGIEMPVARLEGKFKLGQNRSQADQQRVRQALGRESPATVNDWNI